jgi:ABC-type oligopeptide transport system ATPase subunit
MVMRILDKEAIPLELTGLGLDERQVKDLMESVRMPHGLALVTGPTGSGKSTTLYLLVLLDQPDGGSIWTHECIHRTREFGRSTSVARKRIKTYSGYDGEDKKEEYDRYILSHFHIWSITLFTLDL